MPDRLTFVAAVSGGGFDLPTGVVDLRVIGTGAQAAVRISDYGTGEAHLLTPNSVGRFTAGGSTAIDADDRVTIDLPGARPSSLLQVAINDAFDIWDAGGRSSFDVQLADSSFYGDAGALMAVRVGNVDVVYVSSATGEGLMGYQVSTSGVLTRIDREQDEFDTYLGGVTTMASAVVGGNEFLFAGSALEHGITAFSISGSGRLTQTGHIGAVHQLPVHTITALDTVSIGGTTFLIAAAAGSSSLSVMEVTSAGTLHVTDHVMDGRGTRFAGVTEMATCEANGMIFVAVAGSDHGLTLMTLTEQGTLVHLDTIEDSTSTALAGVTGLAMVQTPMGLEIFTTAGADAGISQFRVDLSAFDGPSDTGDNIFTDTDAADTLAGGDGADIFFFTEDGQPDVISDVVVGEDQIDLSGWSFFYDFSQLEISSRSWGARISFQDEQLDLRTADGSSLTAEDIATLVMPGTHRLAVSEQSALDFPVLVLMGSNNDDDLMGTDNSDKVSGLDGRDMLVGLSGDDTLYGGAGNDTLKGGSGDDRLDDAQGSDSFYGGSGNDTVSYFDHRSGVTVNLETGANSSGDTYSSIENLRGSSTGGDHLIGNTRNNSLFSYGGNDTLEGGRGNDTMSGGSGDDFLVDASGRDSFIGGSGDDTVSYFHHESGVTVNLESGTNTSGDTYSSIENLRGSSTADDDLTGHAGDNRLRGFGGDDRLSGGGGNDTLEGGAGDDMLRDASGRDHFIGGSGNDTVSYFDDQTGVTVDLARGTNSSDDTFSGIENLQGSNFGTDSLTGNDSNNRLQGFGGDDRIFGARGNDTLEGGAGNDYLRDESGADVFIGGSGEDTVSYYGRAGGIFANLETGRNNSGDKYTSIEHLIGSNTGKDVLIGHLGDNHLRGFGNEDHLSGGRGDDTLDGGAGDDFLEDASGRDHFIGGTGDDTVSYFDHQSGVTVDLASGANSSGDTFSSIANLRGSAVASDNLAGHAGNNRLRGFGGDDTLEGRRGDDTLEGGAGDDMLADAWGTDQFIGGTGNDTVSYFDARDGVRVHLGTGRNNSDDTYSSIENLRGSNTGDDHLTGHSGDNELRGFGGADTLAGGRGDDTLNGGAGDDFLYDISGRDVFIGGTGNDTLSYFDRTNSIQINLETGANNSGDTYESIENLRGSNTGADQLTGHAGDNRLRGFGGNDTLAGGSGNDTLEGGAGDDFLSDASGLDTFVGGSGNDTVSYFDHQSGVRVNLANGSNSSGDSYSSIENLRGSAVAADDLRGHSGDNRLRGFGGDDRLFGGGGNDTLEGGAGDDYLRDESGADIFIGGSGQDTVSYFGRSGGVIASLETGINNSADTYESIEHLIGSDSSSDELTGHYGDNNLRGFGGDDTLAGGRGDDTLNGGNGDDLLIDVSGRDHFIGGSGDDTVSYSDHQSGVSVHLGTNSNSSGDRYSSIENLIGSATASDTLTGDENDNSLWGQGGDDILIASDGDDRLFGGSGNDRLQGGAGNDYLRDESGADRFYGGSGNDTVSYYGHQSGVTVNLETGSNSSGDRYFSIENLMGSNYAADALVGTQGDNQIWGFGGRDALDGSAGNDTLTGGRGNDTITGGDGEDEFVFVQHDGRDVITDFETGHDTITFNINSLTFADLTFVDTSQGVVITYDPNDTITLIGTTASELGNSDFDFG